MRLSESSSILLLSFLLVLGYLFLDKNILAALSPWKAVPLEASWHRQEVLSEFFAYAATNVFDRGFVLETGPDFHRRLSVYPKKALLGKGNFVVEGESLENIVKIALPEGFRHGFLSLKTEAKTGFSIGVSSDLNNWEFYDYPGYAVRSIYNVSLEKEGLAGEAVYLKFNPSKNKSLSVYFQDFEYTADLADGAKEKEYEGILFFPDIDIDYEGKIIPQPGVLYDNRKSP